MVDTTALVGSARVGAALVGSLGTTPPSRLRVHGACWALVADQAAIDAAKEHVAEREQVVRDDLALVAQEKADAAKQAAIDAATEAATAADEALEAALGEMVEGKSNVFIQDVPPVESMQRQGVLWIDTAPVTLADGTTAPGHTPKTWDPTTPAWVAVTDSVALEAARAAAAAHEAAEAAADAAGLAMAEARYAPRIADRMPTPTDGEGKPAGAGWWQYDPVSQLLVQGWMWNGAVWERLDMDPVMIPVISIGTGTVGDLTGDRVTVTGSLSARVVSAMDAETKRLVVTEEAILNHATLIGQTVVDDINIQGKLIGTDGVFTGTVDFENINVTDQVLAERLAGEHIYGTVVEGGEIRTTDGLPGQVILSDEGYVDPANGARYPGITIIPVDSSELVSPPGMGPNENGFIITGGRNLTGGRGFSGYTPRAATMAFVEGSTRSDVKVGKEYAWVTAHDGNGNQGEILARPTSGQVTATGADGALGLIRSTPSSALVGSIGPDGNYMSSIMSNGRSAFLRSNGSDGVDRVFSVDSDGVWVKTNRSGAWESWNLEETANDTGWQNFAMNSTIQQFGNPAYRIKGGVVWFRGVLQLLSTQSWSAGWTTLGVIPAAARPSMLVRRAITSDAEANDALAILLEVGTNGVFRMRLPRALNGLAQVHMTAMNYPLG